MNVEVSKDEVVILQESNEPHKNEYNITECHFTFDDFTDSFQVKRAIFTVLSTNEMYETDIINNKCNIPIEVLKHEYETVKLGVYGYNIGDNEELLNRFSPSYATFVVPTGSYEEGALSPEIITPSQYDIYSQALQEGLDDVAEALNDVTEALEEVSHVDIDASKSGRTATITITNRNNEEKSVDVSDGISIENMEIADNHLWVTYNEPTEPQDLGQVVPIKGQDYFTTAEIEQIESETKEQVKTDLDFDNTVARIDSDIQDLNSNKASKTELEQEISARELADTSLQGQIDAITSSKDVVDIVGTYSDLQNYDTSTLTEDDVIKVLDDSTHNNAMSYYRWSNNTWTYIGSEGPFYTKAETDARLNTKQAIIDNSHKLASDLVDDTNQTHKFTNENEKTTWNAKYDKPSNGIPKSDLVESVQESLNKADSAIQDVSDKEDKSNKVTAISSSSTDTEYPSAKCVYDSQEVQNEKLEELEMIYNAFPTVSDEDTEIQLDNTAKVKFREIDLKGNTSQVVIPEETGTSVSDTSIYVTDVDTDKENTIELSGNTYQYTTTGKNLLPNERSVKVPVSLTSGTTLVLSTKNSVASSGGNVKLYDIDNNTVWFAINEGTTSATKTLNKDIYYIENKLDGTIEYQCEIGSTPTSFEQYTGGKSSPSPTYSQNIEIVTGTQDVTISNGDNTQNTVYTINLGNIELCKIGTYQDKIYKINNKWYLYKELNKVVLNGSETWKGGNQGTASTNFRYMYTTVSQSVSTAPANIKCNNFQIDIVTSATITDRSVIGTSASSTDNLRVMIDETLIENPTSSLEALTNWRNWLSTHNTIVYYALATPITTEITDTNLVNQLNTLYNANIYSTTNINTNTSNLLPYIDLTYNHVTPSPSPDKPSNINVVKENNTITISNNDNTESQTYPINIGNTELCKIGEYQDYIYENNGNWFFKKNIGKITLNGSEDWTYDSQYSRFYTTISNSLYTGSRINIFCNYYLYASSGHANGTSFMFHSNVYLYNNSYSTTNDFKNWLSTHNTIVYYVLATPTDTQITDTTLITQLNNIKKAYSYDTQTNISQTNTDKPFIIYAEAIRSLKDVFQEVNNG